MWDRRGGQGRDGAAGDRAVVGQRRPHCQGDAVLGSLLWLRRSLLVAGGWNRMSFGSLFQPQPLWARDGDLRPLASLRGAGGKRGPRGPFLLQRGWAVFQPRHLRLLLLPLAFGHGGAWMGTRGRELGSGGRTVWSTLRGAAAGCLPPLPCPPRTAEWGQLRCWSRSALLNSGVRELLFAAAPPALGARSPISEPPVSKWGQTSPRPSISFITPLCIPSLCSPSSSHRVTA